MTYIHLNVCKPISDVKLWLLYSYTRNHLTEYKKMSSGSFKNVTNKIYSQIIHI